MKSMNSLSASAKSTSFLSVSNWIFIRLDMRVDCTFVRALALGNANAKCKGNLTFTAPKTLASENCKQ